MGYSAWITESDTTAANTFACFYSTVRPIASSDNLTRLSKAQSKDTGESLQTWKLSKGIFTLSKVCVTPQLNWLNGFQVD